jgi:hypothetical protein
MGAYTPRSQSGFPNNELFFYRTNLERLSGHPRLPSPSWNVQPNREKAWEAHAEKCARAREPIGTRCSEPHNAWVMGWRGSTRRLEKKLVGDSYLDIKDKSMYLILVSLININYLFIQSLLLWNSFRNPLNDFRISMKLFRLPPINTLTIRDIS